MKRAAAVAVAVVLLAGVAGWQTWRASAAVAEVAQLRADLAASARAEAAHREWLAADEQAARDRVVFNRDLELMWGADAPLSDYLGHAAGKLWP